MNRNAVCRLLSILVITSLHAMPSAMGVVDVSLNVFPDSLANPDGGGSWTLIAKTDNPNGIAAIVFDLQDVDNGRIVDGDSQDDITISDDIGAINPIDEGGANEQPPYLPNGRFTELTYAQLIFEDASVVVEVGTASTNDGPDPLGDPNWDIHTLIAWGTYPDVAPQITGADAIELDQTSPPFTASDDGQTTWVTRVAVPEPASVLLCLMGLAASAIRRT